MRLTRTLYMCLLLASVGFADQVTLKNGDRLSGSILKDDGKELTMKSEFAGMVTIPWEAVTAVTAPGPLHIGLKDGKTMAGAVSTQPDTGKLEIVPKEGPPVIASRDSVAFIRSPEEQAAYERFHNPRLTDLWNGFFDVGYATSQGNSKTSSFTLGGNANRITSHDKIALRYTSLLSSSNSSGKNLTTANAKRGGVSYDRNFNPRWFVFGSLDLEADEFQSLDLRVVPAGGIGAHVINNEKTVLDLQLGVDADREYFFNSVKRTSGEALFGQELSQKFSSRTSLHEKLIINANLTDTGSYRINFDLSAVTAINKWLSWQLSASDRYLSNPVPGRKTNDVILTTGLRITFAR
jgi:putative salt-induced outer membrane protein